MHFDGKKQKWLDDGKAIEEWDAVSGMPWSTLDMHGGVSPGSIGCIDLTVHNDAFHSRLGIYNKPINLKVWYPKQ